MIGGTHETPSPHQQSLRPWTSLPSSWPPPKEPTVSDASPIASSDITNHVLMSTRLSPGAAIGPSSLVTSKFSRSVHLDAQVSVKHGGQSILLPQRQPRRQKAPNALISPANSPSRSSGKTRHSPTSQEHGELLFFPQLEFHQGQRTLPRAKELSPASTYGPVAMETWGADSSPAHVPSSPSASFISMSDFTPSPRHPPSPARQPVGGYRPVPGDEVDTEVASFLNQPRNRLRRSLLCRLGPGEYLYGTRHSQLRINEVTGQLEATDDDTGWMAIEDFARCMERCQSDRMQRARNRAREAAARRGPVVEDAGGGGGLILE